jgi:hypothetical protein
VAKAFVEMWLPTTEKQGAARMAQLAESGSNEARFWVAMRMRTVPQETKRTLELFSQVKGRFEHRAQIEGLLLQFRGSSTGTLNDETLDGLREINTCLDLEYPGFDTWSSERSQAFFDAAGQWKLAKDRVASALGLPPWNEVSERPK